MDDDVRTALEGAAAGAAATGAMTAAMGLARRMGMLGRLPPKKITAAALEALGVRPPAPALDLLTALTHVGFGAAAGALYAWGRRRLPRSHLPPTIEGAAFGTVVWAASYAGWVPALRIMPRPSRDRPGRPAAMVAAHWVYGAALGAATAWLRGERDRPRGLAPGRRNAAPHL